MKSQWQTFNFASLMYYNDVSGWCWFSFWHIKENLGIRSDFFDIGAWSSTLKFNSNGSFGALRRRRQNYNWRVYAREFVRKFSHLYSLGLWRKTDAFSMCPGRKAVGQAHTNSKLPFRKLAFFTFRGRNSTYSRLGIWILKMVLQIGHKEFLLHKFSHYYSIFIRFSCAKYILSVLKCIKIKMNKKYESRDHLNHGADLNFFLGLATLPAYYWRVDIGFFFNNLVLLV